MSSTGLVPEAYFDCLSVAVAAPISVGPFTSREMHLFAYLACLLALFEGEPIGSWGYRFALTSRGYPHSAEFEDARALLIGTAMLSPGRITETFAPTDRAFLELKMLSDLSELSRRKRWLAAATDCALALPVGSIRYAVTSRDDLLAASGSSQPRDLLPISYVDRIHDERRIVDEALGGESVDLLAPAVAWLSLYILASRDQLAA